MGLILSSNSIQSRYWNWNVSNVTNYVNIFDGAVSFNQDIGGWNTSSVVNMSNMFENATSFNQNLSMVCKLLI